MICENSSEIIHLIQLAVDLEVEYTYLRDRVYAHPTMTEALNDILSPNMIKKYSISLIYKPKIIIISRF